ncbi:hypothetical protein ACOSQ2_028791 [Xanthoceras sorbifolium]
MANVHGVATAPSTQQEIVGGEVNDQVSGGSGVDFGAEKSKPDCIITWIVSMPNNLGNESRDVIVTDALIAESEVTNLEENVALKQDSMHSSGGCNHSRSGIEFFFMSFYWGKGILDADVKWYVGSGQLAAGADP